MYDLTIQLQNNTDKCLYEQIYEHIRQEIREGKLLAGEKLPSTRSLAEHLQVARSTVDMAYGQLLSEGYIESRPYSGYYVGSTEELFQLELGKKWDAGILKKSEDAMNLSGGKQGMSAAMPAGRESVGHAKSEQTAPACDYDFSPNGIDMSVFPFGVWSKITKNVLSEPENGLFSLGAPQGDYDLRLTISRYLHSSRGVNCTPDQILVGAGNDYLLLLLEKILGKDVRVAMENPTYMRAYRIFHSCGYEVLSVPMDESGMSVKALEQSCATVAYVMPSHQHPTGLVMPIGRRAELLSWANQKAERYLIEDDYDSEFRYRGKPIPSLQFSDAKGKVIYIGTFSKAIAPAIRVSFMVLPPRLLLRYREQCGFFSSTVSRIDQRILNEFVKNGHFERHLNKVRKLYRMKHERMLAGLDELQGKFVIGGENAGLHLLLTSKEGVSEEELIAAAAAEGVKVYGMSDSYRKDTPEYEAYVKGSGTVLLGYGGLQEGQIAEGLKRLKRAWM